MAIQQMLLGAGKPPTKYYIDDVFSMDPYLGKTAYPYNVLGNVITTGLKIERELKKTFGLALLWELVKI